MSEVFKWDKDFKSKSDKMSNKPVIVKIWLESLAAAIIADEEKKGEKRVLLQKIWEEVMDVKAHLPVQFRLPLQTDWRER